MKKKKTLGVETHQKKRQKEFLNDDTKTLKLFKVPYIFYYISSNYCIQINNIYIYGDLTFTTNMI